MEPRSKARDERGSERWPVLINTTLRSDIGSQLSVKVIDLSANGLRFKSYHSLDVGTRIAIQLPGAGEQAAKVMWNAQDMYGVIFERPMPHKMLDELVYLNPPSFRR